MKWSALILTALLFAGCESVIDIAVGNDDSEDADVIYVPPVLTPEPTATPEPEPEPAT